MAGADHNITFNNSYTLYNNISGRRHNMTTDGELYGDEIYEGPVPLHFARLFPLKYSVPINGYIAPVLVLLTVVTNTLVIAVLLKKHMRSPTNVLLAGMAFSDMLTGVIPLPVFIYFFSMGHYNDFVPLGWCLPYKMLYENIPTIFHTASIWLTVGLAAQRYIYICHSLQARTWCTIPNVLRATVIVYIVAFVSQLTRFIDFYTVPWTVPSYVNPNETYQGCVYQTRNWAMNHMDMYQNIYFWFRIIFIHLVPCISLVVLNGLLISAMRKAQIRRMQLLKQNKKSESRKLKESNCTTLMLVAVVGLFLLVEFPLGIIMTLYVTDNTFDLKLFSENVYSIMTSMSNFFILLSYPLNFFIYCGMSRQFRETFKRLFKGGPMPVDKECSQYMTLPTENGKTVFSGPETAL
ncbi:sex peptide receptor-like [Mercenaria mercenaria]|uniref:sex peptide receptor-like n=1 Tax=Mercenaria mercenaria TaxID=6596 RepID=UPI001E1D8491|nr:sex peptide receptor-like [Mercenaria mercenaria]